ncbi:MAG: hypothetical protein U1G07_02065 [Verrucomicrobiota bacterium]
MKINRQPASAHSRLAVGKVALAVLLLTGGLVLSGCTKMPSKQTAATSLTGVYTLVSVNGNPVPTAIKHENAQLEVRSGTFTINDDGTCRSRMVFVPPNGKEAIREVKASYSRDGAKLDMQWERAGRTTGTVKDDTFTMNNEGMILAYRK